MDSRDSGDREQEILPDHSADEITSEYGDDESNDARLLDDRPPHWAD